MGSNYIHPWLIMLFLLAFTLMSIVGMVRLIKDRRMFGSLLLLLATIVFGFSTYIAATL